MAQLKRSVFLQMTNQTLVARLAAFHADPALNVFPSGFGDQVRTEGDKC